VGRTSYSSDSACVLTPLSSFLVEGMWQNTKITPPCRGLHAAAPRPRRRNQLLKICSTAALTRWGSGSGALSCVTMTQHCGAHRHCRPELGFRVRVRQQGSEVRVSVPSGHVVWIDLKRTAFGGHHIRRTSCVGQGTVGVESGRPPRQLIAGAKVWCKRDRALLSVLVRQAAEHDI
jgi:hypothetical protein